MLVVRQYLAFLAAIVMAAGMVMLPTDITSRWALLMTSIGLAILGPYLIYRAIEACDFIELYVVGTICALCAGYTSYLAGQGWVAIVGLTLSYVTYLPEHEPEQKTYLRLLPFGVIGGAWFNYFLWKASVPPATISLAIAGFITVGWVIALNTIARSAISARDIINDEAERDRASNYEWIAILLTGMALGTALAGSIVHGWTWLGGVYRCGLFLGFGAFTFLIYLGTANFYLTKQYLKRLWTSKKDHGQIQIGSLIAIPVLAWIVYLVIPKREIWCTAIAALIGALLAGMLHIAKRRKDRPDLAPLSRWLIVLCCFYLLLQSFLFALGDGWGWPTIIFLGSYPMMFTYAFSRMLDTALPRN